MSTLFKSNTNKTFSSIKYDTRSSYETPKKNNLKNVEREENDHEQQMKIKKKWSEKLQKAETIQISKTIISAPLEHLYNGLRQRAVRFLERVEKLESKTLLWWDKTWFQTDKPRFAYEDSLEPPITSITDTPDRRQFRMESSEASTSPRHIRICIIVGKRWGEEHVLFILISMHPKILIMCLYKNRQLTFFVCLKKTRNNRKRRWRWRRGGGKRESIEYLSCNR